MDHLSKKLLLLFCALSLFGSSGDVALAQLTDEEEITISARVGADAPAGGGGASGSVGIPNTAVRFSGQAYPNATVYILKGGVESSSRQADALGHFNATLEEFYDSTVVYTLFAVDTAGNKSLLINYPIVIYAGYLTHLSGIRFAPTIVTDKAEVRAGDYLTVTGYSLPSASLEVLIDGEEEAVFTLTSKSDGTYKIIIPLLGLDKGDYTVSIKYLNDERISKLVRFVIGDTNVPNIDVVENIPGDCNSDRAIDLVDFSILAFWYGKNNPPRCVDTNNDNRINLVDFSILAFWWTG